MYASDTHLPKRLKPTDIPQLNLPVLRNTSPPPQCSLCSREPSTAFCLCTYPLLFLCTTCEASHTQTLGAVKSHVLAPIAALPQASTEKSATELHCKLTAIAVVQGQLRKTTLKKLASTLQELDDFSAKAISRIKATIESAKSRVLACKLEVEKIHQSLEKLKFVPNPTPTNAFERIALAEQPYDTPLSTIYDCFEARINSDFFDSALTSLFWCRLTYTDSSPQATPRTPSTAVQTPRTVEASPTEAVECVFCKISLQAMFTAGFAPISLECSHTFHNKSCFLRYLQQTYPQSYQCPSCDLQISTGVVERWVDNIEMEKLANRLLKQCKRCRGMGVLQGLECGHSYCKECCGVMRRGRERCRACVETEELVKNIAF